MRTTLTLDPDVVIKLRRYMDEQGISMKRAINDMVRESPTPAKNRKKTRVRFPTFSSDLLPGIDPARPSEEADRVADEALAERLRT